MLRKGCPSSEWLEVFAVVIHSRQAARCVIRGVWQQGGVLPYDPKTGARFHPTLFRAPNPKPNNLNNPKQSVPKTGVSKCGGINLNAIVCCVSPRAKSLMVDVLPNNTRMMVADVPF